MRVEHVPSVHWSSTALCPQRLFRFVFLPAVSDRCGKRAVCRGDFNAVTPVSHTKGFRKLAVATQPPWIHPLFPHGGGSSWGPSSPTIARSWLEERTTASGGGRGHNGGPAASRPLASRWDLKTASTIWRRFCFPPNYIRKTPQAQENQTNYTYTVFTCKNKGLLPLLRTTHRTLYIPAYAL
jgi:hypothetical protein